MAKMFIKLAQVCVIWRSLKLEVFNLRALLPESWMRNDNVIRSNREN